MSEKIITNYKNLKIKIIAKAKLKNIFWIY